VISERYRQLKEIADKEFGEIIEDSEVIKQKKGKEHLTIPSNCQTALFIAY